MKSIIPSRTVVSKRAHYDCTHDWMWYHLRQRYEYLFLTLIMQHIFSFNHFDISEKFKRVISWYHLERKTTWHPSYKASQLQFKRAVYAYYLDWFVYLFELYIRCKVRNKTFWFLYCRYLTWVSIWSAYSQLMPFIVSMS